MSLIGMADFVGGKYSVPQNPILDGMGDFVNGKYSVPQNPITDGLGSLVPSAPLYPIPMNSVLAASGGMSGLGCGGHDDCGCGGKCSGGMGQFSFSSITAPFTTAFTDLQSAISMGSLTPLTGTDWLVIGGTAALAFMLLSKKGR